MSTSGSTRARRALRLPALAAVLACSLGSLAALQLAGGVADARTPVSCTTVANALGPATGWTEFVEGNGQRNAESEGAMAYGGNLASPSMTVGTFLTSSPADPTLVVAGTHGGPYNLQKGSAYVTPQQDVNFNGGGSYLATNPVDFATAFTQLRALSAAWGSAPATGTVSTTGDAVNQVLVLTGTNTDLNVFSVGQAQISAATAGIRIDVPANSTTIINVTGGSITFGPSTQKILVGSGNTQLSDGTVGPYTGVVWNFPTATSVTLDNGGAFGPSVLAPNALVTVGNAGHTIGQMIAKQFNSPRETHLPLFQSTSCVPGTPPPPGDSDVRITKTASVTDPHGGDAVSYDLLVENVGDSPASGVVVTDALPAGVTFAGASAPCTQSSGVVTCNLGTLAAHASSTVTVDVVANPVAGAGSSSHPQAYHWLTPYHSEAQVSLQPGEQRSVTLDCEPGDILADGQFRVDHVDQDTGTIQDDITILSSQATGPGTWKGVIRNDSVGQAQAKAFIVCLPAQTEAADRQTGYDDSHRHPLALDPTPVTATATYAAGRHVTTLSCPTGTVPVAPGFDTPAGGAVLSGSEYDDAHPLDRTFTVDAAEPTTVTLSLHCLRTTVGQVYGHTHELRFTHVAQTFTVSGHTAKEGDEFQVICPDDAKGVVATWDLPPGLKQFGNDPRLKERAFRIFNDTGTAEQVTLDLLCLHDRTTTERMGTDEPVVIANTATVTSVSADANAFNNSSTATITVHPGSATAGFVGRARVAGSSVRMRIVSSMPGKGALTLEADGKLLARGSVGLRPGGSSTASLRLGVAARRHLRGLERVTVTVDPARGKPVSRTVRLER